MVYMSFKVITAKYHQALKDMHSGKNALELKLHYERGIGKKYVYANR